MKKVALPRIFTLIPIAHRGLHDLTICENTLTSFSLALERRYNIELDVHLTLDGELVVIHDNNLKRLCGKNISVSKLPLCEVKKLFLWDGNKIPTLKEVLSLVDGRVGIDIVIRSRKIKNKYLCDKLLRLLNEYNHKDKIIIKSFNPSVIRYLKKHTDDYAVGQLSQAYLSGANPFFRYWIRSLRVLRYSHADFISYCVSNLPNQYCSYYRKRGYPVIAWTVRNDRSLTKAKLFSDNYVFETIDINNEFQKELVEITMQKYRELSLEKE